MILNFYNHLLRPPSEVRSVLRARAGRSGASAYAKASSRHSSLERRRMGSVCSLHLDYKKLKLIHFPMKKLAAILICLLLVGCRSDNFDWTKPAHFPDTPEGPPEYVQGWRDGCESGRSGYANNFYKFFLTVKQDPDLAQNPVYYQVWKDAYLYCWFYQETTESHGWGNFQ